MAPFEIFIFEIHMVPFLGDFVNFVETIDVELSHKRRDMFVPKKGRQNLILNFFRAPYKDLTSIIGPRDIIEKLLFLN